MAKSAITIIASEETYTNLSTFCTIDELNHAVRTHLENHTDDLNKSAISVLKLLHGYSCKHLGVSFLRKNTIANLIGISRRTVIRACNLLVQLGIIKQYEMKRDTDKLQTSNAIVIQPVTHDVTNSETSYPDTKMDLIRPKLDCEKQPDTQESTELTHQKDNFSSKTNTNTKDHNKRYKERLSADFTSSRVPKEFTRFVRNFYNNAKTIEEFWKVVKYQTRYHSHYSEEDRVDLALDSFKQLVRNIKLGKRKIRSIFAYFNGIVDKFLTK